jgi:hypothetical protein
MEQISITATDLERSKQMRDALDAHKTYDKIKCANNYIGALGELKLDSYLASKGYNYEWHEYINNSYDCPDFIMDKATIDLKTTYSDSLWFQQPKHDIYIHAQMSPDNTFLQLSGFILKQDMLDAATQVKRGNRVDNVISKDKLLPMCWLPLVTKQITAKRCN